MSDEQKKAEPRLPQAQETHHHALEEEKRMQALTKREALPQEDIPWLHRQSNYWPGITQHASTSSQDLRCPRSLSEYLAQQS